MVSGMSGVLFRQLGWMMVCDHDRFYHFGFVIHADDVCTTPAFAEEAEQDVHRFL